MTLSRPTVIGLDVGGGGIRAVALDPDTGEVLTAARTPLMTHRSDDGARVQSPRDWLDGAATAVREVVSHPAVGSVLAIGATSAAHNVVVRRRDGSVDPIMLWSDARPQETISLIPEAVSREAWEKAGVVLDSTWTVAQLFWQAETSRREGSRKKGEIAAVFVGHEWITSAWTGSRGVDPSTAAGTAMFDPRESQWNDILCSAAECALDALPPVVSADSVMGVITHAAARQTGLAPGTPVVAGGTDTACELLALGATGVGAGLVKGATSGTAVQVVHGPVTTSRTLTYPHVVPGLSYVVSPTSSAWSSALWFKEVFGVDAVRAARASRPGAAGITFLPHLDGERVPLWDRNATGTFHGLRRDHTRADLARAVLEGVAFSLRQALENTEETTGRPIEPLAFTGGASNHPDMRQVVSTALARPVSVSSVAEPAVGAARLAARQGGFHPPAAPLRAVAKPADPTSEHAEELHKAWTRYLRTQEALHPLEERRSDR